jgi:hypothetical protein
MVASTSVFKASIKTSLEIAAVTATFFLNCIGDKVFLATNCKRLSQKLLIVFGSAKKTLLVR